MVGEGGQVICGPQAARCVRNGSSARALPFDFQFLRLFALDLQS